MSSSSVENDSGAEDATINGDHVNGGEHTPKADINDNCRPVRGRIVELLEEARDAAPTPEQLGNGTNRYKVARQIDSPSEDESLDALPRRAGSPIDSLLSVPDDSPSIQVSHATHMGDYLLTHITGLCTLFAWWKQCSSLCCFETRPREPNSLLPTLRQTLPIPPLGFQSLSTPRLLAVSQNSLSYRLLEQSNYPRR